MCYAVVSEGFVMELREFIIGTDTISSHITCLVELGSVRPTLMRRKMYKLWSDT
jgi:hypothetical protein